MKNTHRIIFLVLAFIIISTGTNAIAQRGRTIETPPASETTSSTRLEGDDEQAAATPQAPQTFKAEYSGGMYGYNRKVKGTLTMSDEDERLEFRDKEGTVMFVMPYSTLDAIFADVKRRTSTAGRVTSSVPTPYGIGQLGRLFKSKVRYLVIQYRDPDTDREGIASFKLDNTPLLNSVLTTLSTKAGLTRRGEIYVRRKDKSSDGNSAAQVSTTGNQLQ